MTGLALLMAEASLRAAAIAVAAAAVLHFLKVQDASVKSAAWSAVLAGSFLAPFALHLTPSLVYFRSAPPPQAEEFPLIEAEPAFANGWIESAAAFESPSVSDIVPTPIDWLSVVYLAGLAFFLLRIIAGLSRGARLVRDSRRIDIGAAADTRESRSVVSPMTFGWRRPVIILPTDWRDWDRETLRAVIAHEEAHIARGDFFLTVAAALHAALYWFSPHGWLIKQRLAAMSEFASDDRALRDARDRSLYAEMLLHFSSRTRLARMRSGAVETAMAKGDVAARIERALDDQRKLSRGIGLVASCAIAFMVFCAVIGSASVSFAQRPAAPEPPVRPVIAPPPAPKARLAPTAPVAPPAPVIDPFAGEASRGAAPNDLEIELSGGAFDKEADCCDHDGDEDFETSFAASTLNKEHKDKGSKSDYIHIDSDDRVTYVDGSSYFSIDDHRIDFKHRGALYRIEDEAFLDDVREIFAEVDALGEKQERLGEKQEALGEMQSELGERQSDVTVEAAELRERVREQMAEIEALTQDGQYTQDELGELQSRLGDLQGEIGELQAFAGREQGDLGAEQAKLAKKQAELGAQQAELGRAQQAAFKKAKSELSEKLEKAMANGLARRVK